MRFLALFSVTLLISACSANFFKKSPSINTDEEHTGMFDKMKDGITGIFESGEEKVKEMENGAKHIIKGDSGIAGKIKDGVTGVFESGKDKVENMKNGAKHIIEGGSGIPGKIKDGATGAFGGAKDIIENGKTKVHDGAKQIGDAVGATIPKFGNPKHSMDNAHKVNDVITDKINNGDVWVWDDSMYESIPGEKPNEVHGFFNNVEHNSIVRCTIHWLQLFGDFLYRIIHFGKQRKHDVQQHLSDRFDDGKGIFSKIRQKLHDKKIKFLNGIKIFNPFHTIHEKFNGVFDFGNSKIHNFFIDLKNAHTQLKGIAAKTITDMFGFLKTKKKAIGDAINNSLWEDDDLKAGPLSFIPIVAPLLFAVLSGVRDIVQELRQVFQPASA